MFLALALSPIAQRDFPNAYWNYKLYKLITAGILISQLKVDKNSSLLREPRTATSIYFSLFLNWSRKIDKK